MGHDSPDQSHVRRRAGEAIAAELKISRNTVRKYLRMSAEEITAYREGQRRERRLDGHRGYLVHLRETYPRLSAVKVLRKRCEAHGELAVSARTVRRYRRELQATVTLKQERYYEPVLDMAPGVQCQVDGEDLTPLVQGAAVAVRIAPGVRHRASRAQ